MSEMAAIRRRRGLPTCAIADLLAACGLPSADLDAADVTWFCAGSENDPAGVAGLQWCGGDGLLRSLAVRADAREHGLGGRLVTAVERAAMDAGLRTLWLLTETAAEFFAARGYRPARRSDAPPAIAASAEFARLCPAGAVCMMRSVDRARDRRPQGALR